MVKHVVMWRLSGGTAEERRDQADKVCLALEALRGNIAGMSSLEVGIGTGGDEQMADVVLISTHDDWAALKAYQIHPAHLEAAGVIAALRIERRVLDFEISGPQP
jgi:Stress responsive A/B Barrel Domain